MGRVYKLIINIYKSNIESWGILGMDDRQPVDPLLKKHCMGIVDIIAREI
jgi:hypothetical protein